MKAKESKKRKKKKEKKGEEGISSSDARFLSDYVHISCKVGKS
jgi:hypothetical protein